MLTTFRRITSQAPYWRYYSQAASTQPALVRYPYFVSRNSRGSLPVYSDIRNGGGRYFIIVKDVDGDLNALAHDLRRTLFPAASEESTRLRIEVKDSRQVIITGGRIKNVIVQWLQDRGF
ncbi:hypothetical protein JAAARDRAFT_31619 [Jaapia argillacea MUCL 33604]|uniref:Large ribosomal subunit protein mL49 n=1 Tax=Jaapia argillacea MUCL 33604 TaxID=933084 RepID=A0A067Q102_9AGAM|nr:hypothetical protein JAAARDRAFT_31619 [Jaapia argillacea MUCL 33604]